MDAPKTKGAGAVCRGVHPEFIAKADARYIRSNTADVKPNVVTWLDDVALLARQADILARRHRMPKSAAGIVAEQFRRRCA